MSSRSRNNLHRNLLIAAAILVFCAIPIAMNYVMPGSISNSSNVSNTASNSTKNTTSSLTSNSTSKKNSTSNSSSTKSNSSSTKNSQTNTTTTTTKAYTAGSYRVGTDIPAGLYKATATSSAYYAIYPDLSHTTISDIEENENFTTHQWFHASDGELFTVDDATFVSETDAVALNLTSVKGNGDVQGWSRYTAGDVFASGHRFNKCVLRSL